MSVGVSTTCMGALGQICGFLRCVSVVKHALLSLTACTVLAQTIKDSMLESRSKRVTLDTLAKARPVLLPSAPASTSVSLVVPEPPRCRPSDYLFFKNCVVS